MGTEHIQVGVFACVSTIFWSSLTKHNSSATDRTGQHPPCSGCSHQPLQAFVRTSHSSLLGGIVTISGVPR